MSALRIILDGLVEYLIDSLVAVVCALLLHRMRNPISDSISCCHDFVWEREWLSMAVERDTRRAQKVRERVK
jgi:hypothetical protein